MKKDYRVSSHGISFELIFIVSFFLRLLSLSLLVGAESSALIGSNDGVVWQGCK